MSEPAASHSETAHIPDTPVDYTVTVKGTRDGGADVVVALVNERETPVELVGVHLEWWIDEVHGGPVAVYFPHLARRQAIELRQFEVEEGRAHIPDLSLGARLRTRVTVDIRCDGHREDHHASQRLATKTIRRQRPA